MKVSFNNIAQINSNNISTLNHDNLNVKQQPIDNSELLPTGLNMANFYPVSFGRLRLNPDMEFLLKHSNYFRCAYTGKPMISKLKAKNLYQKLEKRDNAQASINVLQHVRGYMHDVEQMVFDIFQDSPHKNKRDFQDILQEFVPSSLEQLQIKQTQILNSTNRLLNTMSEPVAQQITAIRDETLQTVADGTFGRRIPLEKIKAIKAKGKDLKQIIKVYRKWYKFPTSSNDFDAFVVQYSKMPHLAIAKRLISSAVVSVEHVQPHQRHGADELSNLILVSSQFNNSRNTMPLWEFMMLHPEIDFEANLQNYLNTAIKLVKNKNNEFHSRGYYPEAIKKAINAETNSFVELDTSTLSLTKTQIQNQKRLQKLCAMYRMIEK